MNSLIKHSFQRSFITTLDFYTETFFKINENILMYLSNYTYITLTTKFYYENEFKKRI